jgi:hypothetical protein
MLKIWGGSTSSNVQEVTWCSLELDLPFDRQGRDGDCNV